MEPLAEGSAASVVDALEAFVDAYLAWTQAHHHTSVALVQDLADTTADQLDSEVVRSDTETDPSTVGALAAVQLAELVAKMSQGAAGSHQHWMWHLAALNDQCANLNKVAGHTGNHANAVRVAGPGPHNHSEYLDLDLKLSAPLTGPFVDCHRASQKQLWALPKTNPYFGQTDPFDPQNRRAAKGDLMKD